MARGGGVVPLLGGDGDPVPPFRRASTLGIICAALVEPSALRVREGDRRRPARLALGRHDARADRAGARRCSRCRACSRTAAPVDQSADAGAARYLIWHVALLAAAAIALAGGSPGSATCSSSAAWVPSSSPGPPSPPTPLGDLASNDGFSPTMRALVALIVIAQAGVAALWWRRAGGALSWGDMCVLAMMALSALDAFAYMWARSSSRAPGGRASRCAPASSRSPPSAC